MPFGNSRSTVPQGQPKKAQRFERWVENRRVDESRRDGRKFPGSRALSSLRDSMELGGPYTSVKTLGYSRLSLRDITQPNYRMALGIRAGEFFSFSSPVKK